MTKEERRCLAAIYNKFRHLNQLLRDCQTSKNPIYRAAAEMWIAIAEANAKLTGSMAKQEEI